MWVDFNNYCICYKELYCNFMFFNMVQPWHTFVVFNMMQSRLVHRCVPYFLLFICHFSCCLQRFIVDVTCADCPALCKITSMRRQRLTDLHLQKASSPLFSSSHYLHYDCTVLWCVTKACRKLLDLYDLGTFGEWNVFMANAVWWSFKGRCVRCHQYIKLFRIILAQIQFLASFSVSKCSVQLSWSPKLDLQLLKCLTSNSFRWYFCT